MSRATETAHRYACERCTGASRIPRKIPPDFIDTFVFNQLENGYGPNVIANTMEAPGPSISTRWLYELIDRTHGHGDIKLSALLCRKYKKKSPSKKRRSDADAHIIPNRVDIAERP